MNEFSEQVKQINQVKLKTSRARPKELPKSQRQKALDFAKGIVKPKVKVRRVSESSDLNDLQIIEERDELVDDLKLFEARNKSYSKQLELLR